MITVLKLATTPLCHTIAIWKLNNIIINRFQSPQPSMLSDKWQFDTSLDWEVLGDNFDSVSLDTIADNTLGSLNFYFSPLAYLEERASRFVDVTDNPYFTIEQVDNGQPITNSKDETVRNQNKRAVKKKTRLDNLRTAVRASTAGSTALLSFCHAPIFYPRSPAPSSSCSGSPTWLSPLPACLGTPTVLSSHFMPTPVLASPTALTPLSMLGPTPPHLASTAARTFEQAFSDELLCRSTSPAEFFCPFLPLGLLLKKTDRKRTFDTAFINSRPLASNHSRKEFDLSFAECGYSIAVKLNQSWQLKLLDPKPVSIIEAISLATLIF